jgi:transposase-like protein
VVLWRLRYKLSLRDLAEMFVIRGFVFSYEAVRDWEAKLTPALAEDLRRRRKGKVGRSWYVDETYIRVHGRWKYLYRAIDRDGALVDVMLSERRDLAAAKAFFRSAKAVTGVMPDRVTSDGHDAYPRAVRTVLGKRVRHRTNTYLTDVLDKTFLAWSCYFLLCTGDRVAKSGHRDAGPPRRLRCACPVCGARAPCPRFSLPVRNETRIGALGLLEPGTLALRNLLAVVGMGSPLSASLGSRFAS